MRSTLPTRRSGVRGILGVVGVSMPERSNVGLGLSTSERCSAATDGRVLLRLPDPDPDPPAPNVCEDPVVGNVMPRPSARSTPEIGGVSSRGGKSCTGGGSEHCDDDEPRDSCRCREAGRISGDLRASYECTACREVLDRLGTNDGVGEEGGGGYSGREIGPRER